MRIILVFILSLGFLSACTYLKKPITYIQNRDQYYLNARSIPPLKIPPGLSSDKFDNYYPIPERSYPNNLKKISVAPPGIDD